MLSFSILGEVWKNLIYTSCTSFIVFYVTKVFSRLLSRSPKCELHLFNDQGIAHIITLLKITLHPGSIQSPKIYFYILLSLNLEY